jgi:SOS-response transcriptional repressor LexA
MAALTIRQMQVLAFIRDRFERSGKIPGRVEIARELNFRSSRDVAQQLHALAEKRLVQLGKNGAISLLTPPPDMELPLIGRLQEGQSAPQWLKHLLHSLTHSASEAPLSPYLSSRSGQQRLFT